MNKQEIVSLIKDFCCAWFIERNLERTVSFLAEDVTFVGTSPGEEAVGKQAMTEYLHKDIEEITEPFTLEYPSEYVQEISREVYVVVLRKIFHNSDYTWYLQFDYMVSFQDGAWQIRHLHAAEQGTSQIGSEHYPKTLVLENLARQRNELLNDTVAGGMMGGYIAPQFPFYFINGRMLNYLGYSQEEEFINDIGGYISNCMHPEDRSEVDRMVEKQLAYSDEYHVEYRMRKKDGSYIWVHDVGRRITAEDGRPAIISVCLDITSERKSQEEILNLYNNIPGAVFQCRREEPWQVIEANDGLFEFLGYSRQEFKQIGSIIAPLIFPEDRERVRTDLEQQLGNGQKSVELDYRIVCKDSKVKWISLKGQLLKKDAEEFLYCVFVDITDSRAVLLRQREQYIRELEYSNELADSALITKLLANITQNRVEICAGLENSSVVHTGDRFTEGIFHLLLCVVDAEKQKEICSMWERKKILSDFEQGRTNYRTEYRRRQKDGTVIWSLSTAKSYQNPETGDIMFFVYSFDITDSKMTDIILKNNMEYVFDYILDVDIQRDTYRLLSWNEETSGAFPVSGSFTYEKQKYIQRVIKSEEERNLFLQKINFSYMKERLKKEPYYSFQILAFDEKGNHRVKKVQIAYIDPLLDRICMTRVDVTDVVKKEQEQKETLASALMAAEQANAAKSDFLSRMSHEIRTPMNAIIGMAVIAAQAVRENAQAADCIEKIEISSKYLLSLINDILDMNRIESGKMLLKNEVIFWKEFIGNITTICNSQAQAKGVYFEYQLDSSLEEAYLGDAMKLQQVLINILGNAVKFTNPGGKVLLSVRVIKQQGSDAVLIFRIQDTGIGINSEFLPHIFEPFAQESTGMTSLYGGTGLGLAISKNIVDMMGGTISIQSTSGKGTEFLVTVRLGTCSKTKQSIVQKRKSQQQTENEQESTVWMSELPVKTDVTGVQTEQIFTEENEFYMKEFDFRGKRILLAEDHPLNAEIAAELLKMKGFEVELAENGLQAVELFEQSDCGYYDAILMDIRMPVMDGLTAARKIRSLNKRDASVIPVIAMTANAFDEDIEKSRSAGMNAHLAKPIDIKKLYLTLSGFLTEK